MFCRFHDVLYLPLKNLNRDVLFVLCTILPTDVSIDVALPHAAHVIFPAEAGTTEDLSTKGLGSRLFVVLELSAGE